MSTTTNASSVSLTESLDKFTKNIKNIQNQFNLSADQKKELNNQMKTFPQDIQKVLDGKMSYSEMRSLYG